MASPAQHRPHLRLLPAEPEESPRSREQTPVSRSLRSYADLQDAELVALGIQGNRQALEWLYRRHAAFAIHLAIRIEGSAREADDIVHDSFVRAFERLREIRDPGAFRSWLGSIVVREVRTHMRRARLMRAIGLVRTGDPIDLDAIASPDASPSTRAQIAQLYALLQTLPVDDRIAWILRSVEGHDHDTIVRMTSCSLATVKRRIDRAQSYLNEHFVDSQASENLE